MSSRNLLSLLAATALLLACSEDRISGGGDEMGNFVRVSLLDSTGAPAVGARVVVRPADQILSPTDSVPAAVRTLVAGPDGLVKIPSLGTGRWTLVALLGNTGRAETLSTEAGKAVPAETLSLGRLASVVGKVEARKSGNPWIAAAGRAQVATVDSAGNFRLDSVVPGPLSVVASDNLGTIARKDSAVASGARIDLGSFMAPAFLRVTLRDSTGSPLVGARLFVRPAEQLASPDSAIPAAIQNLSTGTDGVAIVDTLPAGNYVLTARLGGTGRGDTLSVANGTTSLPSRILALGRLAAINGHIEPGSASKLRISLAGRAQSTTPDSLGNFRLDSVAPGPVGVVVVSSSGIIGRKDISLASGEIRDVGSFASDWSAWTLQKTIWLNTGARGVATTTTVTDLPIAVSLTNSDFNLSKLRSDFSDLRATRPDGRPLPLSIERWDATGGTLTIWIRMDTVYAGRDSQAVILRGGNASAKAAWTNPFDPAHGWSGVWHMGQDLSDMTGLGHDADDNSSTYKSGGEVGECRWFTRSTPGTMSAPGSGMDADPRGDLTLESWVRLDAKSSNGFDPIVTRKNTGYRLQRDGTTNFLSLAVLDSSSATDTATVKVTGKTNFADGQFHHVVGMRRGDSLLVFVDGVRDGQKLYKGATKHSSAPVEIGVNGSLTWEGMIDELRIGRVARSDEWIRLSYEAQKKTSAFVSR